MISRAGKGKDLKLPQEGDKRREPNMESISISVEPGVCGFSCRVEARRRDKQRAVILITGSECELIRKLAGNLTEVTVNDIFTPHSANPVYKAAQLAGCHLTCPVPIAILKAAEVVLELALPHNASLNFEQHEKKDTT